VFPSGILAYSGTVDAPDDTDVKPFVEEVASVELGGTRYSKYAATMDRLAADIVHAHDIVAAAQEYEMLHPDCATGTIYVDTPQELREQRAAEIVDAVTALGDTANGFSATVVTMKLANNGVLLTEMLEADADEIADRDDRAPADRYLADNPDTPVRHGLPGMHDGEQQGLPLARPAHKPYSELAEQVAETIEAGHTPEPVIDVWARHREPGDMGDVEPGHVGRMYQ